LPVNVTGKLISGEIAFLKNLLPLLKEQEWITNTEAHKATGKSEGSAKKFLRSLTKKSVL
jgi:hypothetical protein